MAFWSSWFAPKCDGCRAPIVDHAPVVHGKQRLCTACHTEAIRVAAAHQAEIDERRTAEEEARRKFEQGKSFGVDPRTQR